MESYYLKSANAQVRPPFPGQVAKTTASGKDLQLQGCKRLTGSWLPPLVGLTEINNCVASSNLQLLVRSGLILKPL